MINIRWRKLQRMTLAFYRNILSHCGHDIKRIYDNRALRDVVYEIIQPLRAMLTPSIPSDGQNCIIYHIREFFVSLRHIAFIIIMSFLLIRHEWEVGPDDTLLPYACVYNRESSEIKIHSCNNKKESIRIGKMLCVDIYAPKYHKLFLYNYFSKIRSKVWILNFWKLETYF